MLAHRPPTGNMARYVEKLSDVSEGLDLIRSKFILGDMNIDYTISKLLRNFKIQNFETKYNLRQLIFIETWVIQTTSTIKDWIYISNL